jgi:hypothetical protein
MSPNPRRSPSLGRVAAAVLSFVVAVLAFPRPAGGVGDSAGVAPAPWIQGFKGEAAIDSGSLAGTLVDFKDDLGLDNRDTTPTAKVWFRWFKKNHLDVDYFDSTRSGSGTLTKNVNFNGTTYSSGETVQSDLGLKLYGVQYRYHFIDLPIVEVGLGLGLNAAQINMELNGSSSGRTTLDETVGYPTISGAVVVKPIPGLHLRAEANGLTVNVSGNHVNILDARVQVEASIAHVLKVFGGYRSWRFDVDASDFGHVESTFRGPYVGLGVKF